ncbi:TPA: methyltransferase domain-containing protein [Pseudomonas aeruginosa]|uniref:methyltransferase domain-containing protein n=1 Tax=Pseudomonas aeruginosa TaxID=287 RepID=UPI0013607902|nr:methyltransferase domain-containing protein [Pseudomonas aeruginosa]MWW06935.1 methyltransferase domain-containing protein [Pseudomonas aeruginosa]HEJ1634722.1 methyltransferase domain-containing protein [Pseudomonas aeruginosa]HEJ2068552.1 methyltransferase domain-containing protein [Pseudomonas aeruginosa]HEJ4469374.1 methyltransferase domain-containing protein [Pseudomonas aeruginosa]HEJ5099311.1 methyltransferase domain-containing protein [Pseudomonas aeruginosa]
MTASLPNGLTDCLLWSEELGMGFHPRPPMDYSGPYFEKYQALDATPMGTALTTARVDMVRRHFDGEVLDVGIGGGRFVVESGGKGFDVNEEAVQWLKSRNAYADPYKGVAAITCWDSLEHVPDPEALVRSVGEWVFVSMPVYKDQTDCLKSKHFKPGEHLHYWSVRGLVGWFAKMNFGCVEINERESELGREGITSFAFRRFHG